MRPIRANITTSDMPSHVASKHNHFILVYTAHQMKQFIPKSLLFHIQFPWVRSIYHETHTHLTAFFPGLPGWPSTRKVKPIWILPKQETVNGIGISWDICKPEPSSRQITMPAPHHSSFFYKPDALPAAQPTVSKHWRPSYTMRTFNNQSPKTMLKALQRLIVKFRNAFRLCTTDASLGTMHWQFVVTRQLLSICR